MARIKAAPLHEYFNTKCRFKASCHSSREELLSEKRADGMNTLSCPLRSTVYGESPSSWQRTDAPLVATPESPDSITLRRLAARFTLENKNSPKNSGKIPSGLVSFLLLQLSCTIDFRRPHYVMFVQHPQTITRRRRGRLDSPLCSPPACTASSCVPCR